MNATTAYPRTKTHTKNHISAISEAVSAQSKGFQALIYNSGWTVETMEQWTAKSEPAPKKTKTLPSAGKIMSIVF